jgi:hypothetical protein
MQPGETITPGTPPSPAPMPEQPQVPSPAPAPQPPVPPTPEPAPQPEVPRSNWQYNDDQDQEQAFSEAPQINPVSWTASEYIAHAKGMAWFIALGFILFVVVALAYFVTKDVVTPVVLAVAGITFGVFAARSPRVLQYTIDSRGIQIDQKVYPYAELRSFDIIDEGPLPAILLMPLKRFLPPITVFYDEKEEDAILNVLGSYLPHQEQKPDAVDRLMRHIRF